MIRIFLTLFVLCFVSCKASDPTPEKLNRTFWEGYVSATDAYAANALHGIAFHIDVPWKKIRTPFLILKEDATDYEVGEFCGEFNAYVMAKQGKWAMAYRDSFSIHFIDEEHPASAAANGFALCLLLKGMKIGDAIDKFGIGTPNHESIFAGNCELSLGHDLSLLIHVDTSRWPKSDDGLGIFMPPAEELVVKEAFLYYKDESITGILDWAKLSNRLD